MKKWFVEFDQLVEKTDLQRIPTPLTDLQHRYHRLPQIAVQPDATRSLKIAIKSRNSF